jgi:hypothetical protein
MGDPIDNAIDSAETDTKESQKRGPRDRYYFCAALQGKKIVTEAVMANSPEDATLLFQEKHGVAPTVCDKGEGIKGGGAGFYLAMGTGMSDAQRISVTVTAEQLARRTTKAFKAQFRGWHVWGSGLAACKVKMGSEDMEFNDNDLVSIEFAERVDKNNKSLQKPKLKKKEVVRLSDLEHVQTL